LGIHDQVQSEVDELTVARQQFFTMPTNLTAGITASQQTFQSIQALGRQDVSGSTAVPKADNANRNQTRATDAN
jgi:hypothetical protein